MNYYYLKKVNARFFLKVQLNFTYRDIVCSADKLSIKACDVDDYLAMLWMPPNPDHIKIQKITKVEASDDSGMIGVWNGVSKDDVSKIMF